MGEGEEKPKRSGLTAGRPEGPDVSPRVPEPKAAGEPTWEKPMLEGAARESQQNTSGDFAPTRIHDLKKKVHRPPRAQEGLSPTRSGSRERAARTQKLHAGRQPNPIQLPGGKKKRIAAIQASIVGQWMANYPGSRQDFVRDYVGGGALREGSVKDQASRLAAGFRQNGAEVSSDDVEEALRYLRARESVFVKLALGRPPRPQKSHSRRPLAVPTGVPPPSVDATVAARARFKDATGRAWASAKTGWGRVKEFSDAAFNRPVVDAAVPLLGRAVLWVPAIVPALLAGWLVLGAAGIAGEFVQHGTAYGLGKYVVVAILGVFSSLLNVLIVVVNAAAWGLSDFVKIGIAGTLAVVVAMLGSVLHSLYEVVNAIVLFLNKFGFSGTLLNPLVFNQNAIHPGSVFTISYIAPSASIGCGDGALSFVRVDTSGAFHCVGGIVSWNGSGVEFGNLFRVPEGHAASLAEQAANVVKGLGGVANGLKSGASNAVADPRSVLRGLSP